MQIFRLVALGGLLMMSVTACNTIEGIGRDVEAAGEKLGREADDHRTY